jgi:methyl-accepting chemotaxis protein
MNFGHKVEEVNEDLREVGAAAEEGGQGASKTAEEIKQKFKEAGDAVDSTGNKIDRVVKGSKDAGINGKSKD